MLKRPLKLFSLIGSVFVFLTVAACEQKEPDLGKEVLIRVSDRVMTVLDFNSAFEIAKIAYDDNIKENPEDRINAQIRLLNELTVEMILLERAEELAITVSEAELEKAVSAIKSDYPEGEFEKTLLEFAVSYEAWENRLRNRLIIDKVIEEELNTRITITPEDISEFYQKNYQDREDNTESAQESEDINEAIVKQLRRIKAEESYNSWIDELRGKYEIEINRDQWERLTGSLRIEENDSSQKDISQKN
ncbi:MAG: SurA N-terminal domain-containing protein [Desulfobacterales bacterium]|nr:SurA N-terminal domain-containing protein [Desulfobacterales bacterium]